MDDLTYSQNELGVRIHSISGVGIISKDSIDVTKKFFYAIAGKSINQQVSEKDELMCEVERKILKVSFDDIQKRISQLNQETKVTIEFTREIFHAVWVQNFQTNQRFRIRQEGGEGVRAEYKSEGINGYKQETGLNVFNSLDEILSFAQELGFKEISETIKFRTQWRLNYSGHEVRVLVDEFQNLRGLKEVDPIAEIEIIVSAEKVGEAEQILFKISEILGFSQERVMQMGENKLFELYSEKLGQKNL